jgi:single-stranded-DNA-specific exonuclease
MEPFGPANPKPVFLFKSLNLCSPPRLVGEKHIKLKFSSSNLSSTIDGIWFNSLDRFNKIKSQSTLDVVATLSENFYNGKTSLQLMISDIRSPS